MRGERARIRPEDHLSYIPFQLSPGRPYLLPSPVERCWGTPARTPRAGRARLHYVGREDPGDGHRNRAAERPLARRGIPPCPHPANARPAWASRSKTPDQNSFTKTTRNTPEPLDIRFLRWLSGARIWVSSL